MDPSMILDKVRKFIEKSPAFIYADMIEKKTGVFYLINENVYVPLKLTVLLIDQVNYEYFAVGLVVIVGLCIFFGVAAELITNLIGLIYPLISTLAALEVKVSEQKKWLVYWTIFVSLVLFEEYFFVVVNWVPFYFPAKTVFLVYMMAPAFNGALVVYDAVKPYLDKLAIGDAVDAGLNAAAAASEKSQKNE